MQTVAAPVEVPAAAKPAVKSGYIVHPFYDGLFFIFSPLVALGIGMAISGSPLARHEVTVLGHQGSVANLFIGSFVFAHLVLVFFRSHANGNIFRLYPVRFTVVPILLFGAMILSKWILITVAVVAVWWDVYHSSLQTFGLGRIYDVKKGNNPSLGRQLDFWLNLLLYAGPIIAGVSLIDHIDSFDKFSEIGSVFLTAVPAYAEAHHRWLTWGVISVGVPFLIYYVWSYWRLSQRGYQVSFQKVLLYVSTAACSIYTWGFDSFGEAFFIMNFFHALQYFALVWWSEQKTMIRVFRLGSIPWGKPIALVLFLAVGFAYGLWAEVSDDENTIVLSAVLVVSIMHFWYDGFIWSVRKKQI